MADSDDCVSLSVSKDSQDACDHSDSNEVVVSDLVEPYQDEPLGRSSDESQDNEEDADSLTPANLRTRFEGEKLLDEW